jgi:Ca2+-binding RTX toxin-like protein
MNKKLIYTSIWLCLGGLALTNSASADSDNANNQSVKKCTINKDKPHVELTKKLRYGHVNDGDLLLDPTDDFYEVCKHADFDPAGCDPVGPVPLAVDTTDSGNGVPFIDPETGLPVTVDGPEGPIIKLFTYTGLSILGSNRSDVIEGTRGHDQICGQSGNDVINGFEGNDDIQGNNGNDTLIGGPGNDKMYGGNGSDSLFGYDEDDSDDPAEVEEVIGDGGGDFDLDGDVDEFDTDVDILEGGNGKDVLFGGPNHDDLSGGNGNDELNGSGGDDDLDGDNGKDALDGGEGIDNITDEKGKNTCTDDASDCSVVKTKNNKGGKKVKVSQ